MSEPEVPGDLVDAELGATLAGASLDEVIHAHAVHNPGWWKVPFPPRRCADGFEISVQVGYGLRCAPWGNAAMLFDAMDRGQRFPGPGEPAPTVAEYRLVECGMPSERPEPWALWETFCEEPGNPTGTVYNYVPVEVVRMLLEAHGGEVTA